MRQKLASLINKKFAEELQFLKQWSRDKNGVGALFPTSEHAARRMASVVDVTSGLPVLELGPGTGSVTEAILETGLHPSKLHLVEYSKVFCRHLIARFPDVNVTLGDAFDLDTALGEYRAVRFDCIISALPLLNVPMEKRINLIRDLLSRLPLGRPVIQITYGPGSPIPKMPGKYLTTHYDLVLRNVPPAQLWIYRLLP